MKTRYGFLGEGSYSYTSSVERALQDFRRQLNTYTHGRASVITEKKRDDGEYEITVSISGHDLATVNKMVCNEYSAFNKGY